MSLKHQNTMQRFELLPEEHIIIENPKHWKNYIIPMFLMMVCAVGAILRMEYSDRIFLNEIFNMDILPLKYSNILSWIEAIVFLLVFIGLSASIIDTAYTRYYVTDKRIISSSGFLNVRINEMTLERCETVSMTQRIMERVFDSGDILCISAGASIYLDDVYHARQFKQTIIKMITEKETE